MGYSLLLWGNLQAKFTLSKKRKASLRANIKMKGRFIIISITKEEAFMLSRRHKVKFHDYNGISTTHTKHKKYFLTESKYNIDALKEIRGAKICKIKPNLKNKRVGV